MLLHLLDETVGGIYPTGLSTFMGPQIFAPIYIRPEPRSIVGDPMCERFDFGKCPDYMFAWYTSVKPKRLVRNVCKRSSTRPSTNVDMTSGVSVT